MVVWLMIISFMVLFPLQLIVKFDIPFSGAIYALMLIVGGYVGLDQFSTIVTTKKLPDGYKYTGSYKKLLFIVIAMWALLFEALIFQGIISDKQFPLDELFIAVGIVSGIFAGGNKMNNANEGIDLKRENK